MFTVTGLYRYPVKSLGGIALTEADVTETGFRNDRRWMLIDENSRYITQREFSVMALLVPSINNNQLSIQHKHDPGLSLHVPLEPLLKQFKKVTVWSDHCNAQLVSKEADEWFSDILHTRCQLVYMPDKAWRRVDGRYARNKEITTFTDGYPFLMISEESLADLNTRLEATLPMDRFRPSIVFNGAKPYEEDLFEHFNIGAVEFSGVKRCGRCMMTTIDQQTLATAKEPLKTLASYRFKNNKIYFGQYLLHHGEGVIATGAEITVTQMKGLVVNSL
jgi:uncharacterized protein YcbX